MKMSRLLLPLLFVLLLVSAQQFGAVHALHHAIEDLTQQHDDKQVPHSDACWKCAAYAQLGSALNVAAFDFIPPALSGTALPHIAVAFRSIHILAANARAPPHSA